jgi:putative oxidoreductase
MRIVVIISRILLGLMFFVFGLNGFLNFMKPPQPPTGLVADFMNVMMIKSHYFWLVAGCQVLSGILLLANRYVTLGLVILAAIIVNILTFHLAIDPKGIVPGIVCGILWLVVAWSARGNLAGIFEPRLRSS